MAAVRNAAGLTFMGDELNPQILSEWLAGMSLPERERVLNRIAHSLTICAREFEAAAPTPSASPAGAVAAANAATADVLRQLADWCVAVVRAPRPAGS